MPRNYLKSSFHLICLIFLSILGFLELIYIFFPVLIVYLLSLFFFRKSSSIYEENLADRPRRFVFSPLNARVGGVYKNQNHAIFGRNLQAIKLILPWWKEPGIFLPFDGEIKDLFRKEKRSFWRYSRKISPFQEHVILSSFCLSLQSKWGDIVGIQFFKCPTGSWPELIVMPGDTGRARVNIGFIPFGGSALLYLPEKYEILVNIGDDLMAGESVLARSENRETDLVAQEGLS